MKQEPGPATQRLIEIVRKELETPQHPGSVYLAVPIGYLVGFLEEHGVEVPEVNRLGSKARASGPASAEPA